ncbi:MAG TPA: phosphate signaling complex protein PhoU [Fimbriimonadaceae bacterium]|nr:phosphate signaling complex protein PhoU [Fimbriimonadaceae bacterium]
MPLTRTQFLEELETLRNLLLEMGSLADRAVAEAMRSLTERDSTVAERVINRDDEIDEMDLRIETECMRLLALQHPLASDLRLVATAIKIITDLERIGDHAVDIAKVARKLSGFHSKGPLADLPKMANAVRKMLRTALDAFVKHDLNMVEEAVQADDQVDDLFHSIRDDLHRVMQENPELVVEASYSLFVAHYLERMADHAVNIAERVHFAETGELAQIAKMKRVGN